MIRCNGRNKDGERCKKRASKGSRYCVTHKDQAPSKNHALSTAVIGALTGVVVGSLPGAVVGFFAGALIGNERRTEIMEKTKVLVSFDYDNDSDLKTLLIGQSKHPDTPFEIADWSVKEHLTGDWKEKVRSKLRRVDQVIVICGEKTHTATGVSAEVAIAQEEGVPYFLLYGRASKTCTKPKAARASDKMYKWTWDNLKSLIGGAR